MCSRINNKWLSTALVLTLVFSLLGMYPSSNEVAAAEEDIDTLTILHTNDIHATIEDFAKAAHYISSEREKADNFLYLDAGDMFSGSPVVDLPKGEPLIELYNKVGLDAVSIGNHDFDYGPENFNLRKNESDFAWLSANTEVKDSIIEQPDPYKIFEMNGFTVGVLGLTQAPPATAPKNVKGVEFHGYQETVEAYQFLSDEVDVLVGLTHIGYSADQALAQSFPSIFDLIIGGHSHTTLAEARIVEGTPIVQTGSNLKNIGHLTLKIDKDSKEVISVDYHLQKVADITDIDEEVQQMVDGYFADVEEMMSEVIGYSETGLSSSGKNSRDVPLGNFWTDAMRYMHDGDMAVTNGGGIRGNIAPGEITVGDIFEVEPFANQVMIINMTGQMIKNVIEYSYKRDGRSQIDLQTSGLHYTIFTDAAGRYVDAELMINGELLDMDATYRVVAPDYIGSGGSGYNFEGEVIAYEAGLITDAMIDYAKYLMQEKGVINYETEGRIQTKRSDDPPGLEPAITVAEAIANNEGEAVVEGYVVGHVIGPNNYSFDPPFNNDYNLLLADSHEEQDPNKLLPVQITSEFRSEFGLETNPDLLGKRIKVAGNLETYYTVPGLKSPHAMELVPVQEVLTIAEVRQLELGEQATIEGVVTTIPGAWGTKAFYIQDDTGGILVYQHDFNVEQGDYVRVHGMLKDFNGEIEFDPVINVEVLKKSQPLPDPKQMTPGQVSRDNQGELISLKDVTISNLKQVNDFGTFEFIASKGSESVQVRVDNRTGLSYHDFQFDNGDVVDITGISSEYRGTYQVKPRYADDIVAAEGPNDGNDKDPGDGSGEEPGDGNGEDPGDTPSGGNWYADGGAPDAGLGNDGDLYLDTSNGDIYQKEDGTWNKIGNIKGDDKDDDGASGTKWHTGEGVPSDDLGNDGDLYLDTVSGDVYEKTEEGWKYITNLVGPEGPQEPEGTEGQQGPEGPEGPQGEDPEGSMEKGKNGVSDSQKGIEDPDKGKGKTPVDSKKKLPKTALAMWNWIMAGVLLLGMGLYLSIRRRRIL